MKAMPDINHPLKSLPGGTVTFLFTDIEGSTRLLTKLGDQYAQVLAVQRQILRKAIESWQGQEVDTQGDAFFVAFARASDAVSAVIQAQRSMVVQSWPDGLEVRVRMGLHTGEARVTEEGYVGMDVHRAARICSAGHGGQILLSHSTAALVNNNLPEGLHLRDLGEHRLKDLSYPERLFQLNIPGQTWEFPALKSLNAMPNNLPVQLTSFVGRQQEIEQLEELLRKVRLITITGPGGSGKSRLSIQAAANLIDQFPDGVWLVPLETLDSVKEIAPAIANALHFRIDTHSSDLDPEIQLSDYLANRSLLLVLDKYEHLLDGAEFLRQMLVRAPQVRVLITSRERLNLTEEWVFTLAGLDFPHNGYHEDEIYSALTLFQERARQTNPAYSLTPAERSFASIICRLVGGMPLGIELAAPWTALLSCREIAQEIEQNLDFLTDTFRDMPEGHRSLRAVFDHSWRRLNQTEQRAFCNLSVFQGGFDRTAAQQVADVNLPMLMDLANKSLIQRSEGERFQMHALLYQFVIERLRKNPAQENAVRERHSRYYLAILEKWQTSVPGDAWQQALDNMLRENRNIRDAIRWVLIHWEEEEAGQALDSVLQLLFSQGFFEASTAYKSFIEYLRENGASLEPGAPKRSLLLKAISANSACKAILGDLSIEADARECLENLRGLDFKFNVGLCLFALGVCTETHSLYQEALESFEKSYQLLKELRYFDMTAASLLWLGWTHYEIGNYSAAEKYFNEAYRLSKQQGVGSIRPYALSKLGTWADATGDFSQGLRYHQEALQSFKQLGDQAGQGYALTRMCLSALGLGDYTAAAQYGRAGYEQFEAIGHRWGIATGLCRIGFAELGLENYAEAQVCFLRGLKCAQEYHYPATSIYALIGLACLWARQGEIERAVEVLTFATEHKITPALYKNIADKELSRLQASLVDERFSAAKARGRAFDLQALADKLIQPEPLN